MDADQVGRHLGQQDALALLGALPDQPLAEAVVARFAGFLQVGIAGEALQALAALAPRDEVHHALVRVDQRRELREQHLGHAS